MSAKMSSASPSKEALSTPYMTGLLNYFKLKAITTVSSLMSLTHKTQHPPTLTKQLDPSLGPTRIFFPPNANQTSAPLPTLFSIHGGGFCFGAPIDDDHINARLAADGILVISIPYPFAPTHPFPAPLAAIASQMQKALSDPELPIDSSRLGLIGFSAGGNLALAVQQLAETPKVKAAVAFYPPVDFMLSKEQRLQKRVPIARSEPDMLAPLASLFEWAYIPAGTSLKDPSLSPRYAARSMLCEWLFVVGAERDMLCTEDGEMVAGWLGEEWGESGRDEMVGNDGKTRWLRVNGQKHAYTHEIPPVTAKETVVAREERKRKDVEVLEDVGSWLMNGPFKK